MKIVFLTVVAGIAALPVFAAKTDWSKLPAASAKGDVTFAKDIQPLFKESCVRCHGAEHPKAQLRLDSLEGVLKGAKKGSILKAGDSAASLLVRAVSRLDPEIAMPPKPRAPRGPGGESAQSHGTNASAMQPRHEGGEPPHSGGPQETNAPGQRPHNFGPPPKPLTAEQVGLIRAWIDQGAK